MEKAVRDTFTALDCRDVARIDLRMGEDGTLYVIEVNPLPGLAPGFSDLCVIGQHAGMDHNALIGEILAGAIKRAQQGRASAAAASPAANAAVSLPPQTTGAASVPPPANKPAAPSPSVLPPPLKA
jgi:D-alanine-D-alanine ligase